MTLCGGGAGGVKKGSDRVAEWQLTAMAICLFRGLKARPFPLRSQALSRRSLGRAGPGSGWEMQGNQWTSLTLLPAERWFTR